MVQNTQSKQQHTQQIAVRMSSNLLERIDAFAEKLQKRSPGLRITRADAIRVMIESSLAQSEAENSPTQ